MRKLSLVKPKEEQIVVKWLGKTNYKQPQLRENSCNES